MKYLLRTLGFVWALPATILIWLILIIPPLLTGAIRWHSWHSYLVARFDTVPGDTWYRNIWKRFGGWGGPCAMIINPAHATPRTLRHEERHCDQSFFFGVLHYPLYGIAFVVLAACPGKHGYTDNPFEVDARKAER